MKKGDITKQRIIETAIDLFRSDGYRHVSLQHICQCCGVTTGSFYHHFSGKGDILRAWFRLRVEDEIPHLEENLRSEPNAERQFFLVLDFYINLAMSLGRSLLKEMITDNDLFFLLDAGQIRDKNTTFYDLMTDQIKNGQKAGCFTDSVSGDFLFQLVDSILLRNLFAWSRGADADIKAICRRQAAYILKGI